MTSLKNENPELLEENNASEEQPVNLDPTRYGDWVKNGRAIDF